LNISAAKSTSGKATPTTNAAGAPETAERRALDDEVIAELTSWNPREFIGAFRRWHQGSLSLVHLNVLTTLELDGPLSMGKLAESLDVSVASATGIVDRMEQRGLVERRHNTADRRVVIVHPAAGGAKVFQDIDEHRRAALGRLLTRLSDAELSGLLNGHRALRAARAAVVGDRDAKPATDDTKPAADEGKP